VASATVGDCDLDQKITQIDLGKIHGINGLPTSTCARIRLKYGKQRTYSQNIALKGLARLFFG
jgi:hypothetical protein